MAAEKKPRAAKAKRRPRRPRRRPPRTKPKVVRARKPKAAVITPEQVAERAYYIWADGSGDDPFANWIRAERELQTA